MSLDDWILALHLLSAFALVGGMVLLWSGYLLLRADGSSAAPARIVRIATPIVASGTGGTLLFGIWLAISLDAYEIWDGWIIAAIVLWAIGSGANDRSGRLGLEPGGVQKAIPMHAVSSVAALLILILMIWKPGA